ncbi:MAG: hypothetical protein ACTTIF_01945, partial [Prevotella sp.]
RYAFDETSAHLLNNRTKSDKDSNERLGINLERHRTNSNTRLVRFLAARLNLFVFIYMQKG